MRKKIFGICDTDRDYLSAFSGFIQRREGGRFTVLAFSRPELAEEYLRGNSFDLLLVSESFIEAANACRDASIALPPDATFILAEQSDSNEYAFPAVYKYQSAEKILERILAAGSSGKDGKRVSGRTRVIGVYSPAGRCGKTALALALQECLSERGSSLLLCLDDICGREELCRQPGDAGISNLIYRLSSGEELSLEDLPLAGDGSAVIRAADDPEDIRGTDAAVFSSILEFLRAKAGCRYVVVDVGNAVAEPCAVLECCQDIFMPVPDDPLSARKAALFEQYAGRNGDLAGRIRQVGPWQEGREAELAAKLLRALR